MSKNKKYEPTKGGYKEVEEKALKDAKTVAEQARNSKDKEDAKEVVELAKEEKVSVKVPPEEDLSIPYPDKGGHSVAQLVGMEDHKRKGILAEKDAEFVKKYASYK